MYRIGIDLGGTNIAAGLVNEENRICFRVTKAVQTLPGKDTVLSDLIKSIEELMTGSAVGISDCNGIGVGTPGKCSADGTVFHAFNLGWDGVPLGSFLAEHFHLPVIVRNDADSAALGEVVAGAAKGCKNALLITLGTGIGGGFVIDGEIFAGREMFGGEFGHICIQMDGELCTCGERGCWEAYASATALIRQANAALAAHPESALCKMRPLDGEKVFAAASEGDRTAQNVIQKYTEYIGVGLTGLVNALYPEVILVGGGISNANEALLNPLRAYVEAHYFLRRTAPVPPIRKAMLGNDAGIIGAAALVR